MATRVATIVDVRPRHSRGFARRCRWWGGQDQPPPDWQARVWARIAASRPRRSRRSLWVGGAAAAAVVLLGAYLTWRTWPLTERPTLIARVQTHQDSAVRGDMPHPGDQLLVDADIARVHHAELRLYRDDHALMARCSNEPPCTLSGRRLRAEFTLPSAGRYRALLLLSPTPLPPPTGSLDGDVAKAVDATVLTSATITVW